MKKYIIVSCSFSLLLLHMIGSDFNINEYFYSFDNFTQLQELQYNPFHFFFSSMIRPFMPLHFVGILMFLRPGIYDKLNWPKIVFIFATVMLVFYYSIIYTCGLYALNVLRTQENISPDELLIFKNITIFLKSFLKTSLDHVMVSMLEVIRGCSVYFIFKEFKCNKYYLNTGIAILVFQIISTVSGYIEFFGYEAWFFQQIKKINLTHIVLQYWIVFQLIWLTILKHRKELAIESDKASVK